MNELFAEFLTKVVKSERIAFSEPGDGAHNANDGNAANGTAAAGKKSGRIDEHNSWSKTTIDLHMFGERIKSFLEIQVEVSEIKTVHDIDFLKVNAQPIKQAISTWVTKWLYVHTQYLQNYVGERLNDIFSLLQDVNNGNATFFVFLVLV